MPSLEKTKYSFQQSQPAFLAVYLQNYPIFVYSLKFQLAISSLSASKISRLLATYLSAPKVNVLNSCFECWPTNLYCFPGKTMIYFQQNSLHPGV